MPHLSFYHVQSHPYGLCCSCYSNHILPQDHIFSLSYKMCKLMEAFPILHTFFLPSKCPSSLNCIFSISILTQFILQDSSHLKSSISFSQVSQRPRSSFPSCLRGSSATMDLIQRQVLFLMPCSLGIFQSGTFLTF